MTETPLDAAHALMTAAPDDDAARLAYLGQLAGSELFLLLERDTEGGSEIAPKVFPLQDGPLVLAFDREDRLTSFVGGPAPYAALSGDGIARHLAGKGVGLGVNLGVGPGEFILPPDGLGWLAETAATHAEPRDRRPIGIAPPDLPERLLVVLDQRLAALKGLASHACIASARYEDGASGHLLAVIGAQPGIEDMITDAVQSAMVFSGLDNGELDVAFLEAGSDLARRLEQVGLRLNLPVPEQSVTPGAAPGMDPDRPPRLL